MNTIANKTLDQERALYGLRDTLVKDCIFDGPADGESAFKECADVEADHCFFNLRYPFWHDEHLTIRNSEMTELCRAALWYSHHITIADTKLHGIKALRECSDVKMTGCDIVSPEFGWSVHNIEMEDCDAQAEYFMMRSTGLRFPQRAHEGEVFLPVHRGRCVRGLRLRHQGRLLARQKRGGEQQHRQGRVPGLVLRERHL